jgi:SPP1 gp7 family putative phage head morphogenesis protein
LQGEFTELFKTESAVTAEQVLKGIESASNVLTTDEVVEKVLKDLDFKGWSVLINPTEEALEKIYADGTRAALAQISFDATDGMTSFLNERASAYAAERAADLVGMKNIGTKEIPHWIENPNREYAITDTTRDMLRSTIKDSIDKGYSTDKLKQEIIDNHGFSEDRADMIARTETAFADIQGNMEAYRASGVVDGKEWILGSEHDDDDECDDNVADGVIALEDSFSSGDDCPPAHPNCTCDVLPVVMELEGG